MHVRKRELLGMVRAEFRLAWVRGNTLWTDYLIVLKKNLNKHLSTENKGARVSVISGLITSFRNIYIEILDLYFFCTAGSSFHSNVCIIYFFTLGLKWQWWKEKPSLRLSSHGTGWIFHWWKIRAFGRFVHMEPRQTWTSKRSKFGRISVGAVNNLTATMWTPLTSKFLYGGGVAA